MADGTAGGAVTGAGARPPRAAGGAVGQHQRQPIPVAGPAALMGWDGRKGTVMWAGRSGLGFAIKGSLACFSLVFPGYGERGDGRVVGARSSLGLGSARLGGRPSCAGACPPRTRLWECERRNRNAGGLVGSRARETRASASRPSCCSGARRQGSVLGCRRCPW